MKTVVGSFPKTKIESLTARKRKTNHVVNDHGEQFSRHSKEKPQRCIKQGITKLAKPKIC